MRPKFRENLRLDTNNPPQSIPSLDSSKISSTTPKMNILRKSTMSPRIKNYTDLSSKRQNLRSSIMKLQCVKENSPLRLKEKMDEDFNSLFLPNLIEKGNSEQKKKGIYHVISQIYLCKKFVRILLNLTSLRKPKTLNSEHFQLINDKACSFSDFRSSAHDIQNDNKIFKRMFKFF